jgi:hypothetical protein
MIYSIAQGSLQILMNRYQIGRLYNLVARGEASRMDVTAEIVDLRFVPSMGFLIPFLFMVHLLQLWIGYVLLNFTYHNPSDACWQSFTLGCIFVLLSFGNFWTTLGTIIRKRLPTVAKRLKKLI